MGGEVFSRIPFHTTFKPRRHSGDDTCGKGEWSVVRRGKGDYIFGMEEYPECVAADAVYFREPFFVGTGCVGFLEEGVGWVFWCGVG
jgi:hypothetical protein